MRITIDIDPTTASAEMTGPTSAKVGSSTQAPTQLPAKDVVLDAGAASGDTLVERTSALPQQNTSAGITAQSGIGANTIAPKPHADSFGLASTGLSEGVLSAGSAKG